MAAAGRARLERREAEKGQVSDRVGWLATDRRRTLEALSRGDRSVLDLPPAPGNGSSKADPLESSAVAQRQIAERNDRRRRGESACGKCAEAGVIELDDGSVERCDCTAARASA